MWSAYVIALIARRLQTPFVGAMRPMFNGNQSTNRKGDTGLTLARRLAMATLLIARSSAGTARTTSTQSPTKLRALVAPSPSASPSPPRSPLRPSRRIPTS